MKKTIVSMVILVALLLACTQSPEKAQQKQAAEASQPAVQPTTAQASTGATVQVSIKGFAFVPADLSIKAGDTVEWTNNDQTSHTVETGDGTVKSGEILPGETFRFKFSNTGTFDYKCGFHPSMHGSVTVA